MKRVGLRRVLPRVSYAIRWLLVQSELSDRFVRQAPPALKAKIIGMQIQCDRMMGL